MSQWRYPFSFGITPSGGLFILMVFLIAVAAVNTGHNLLYLILALLLSAMLVSGIVARLSLRSVFVSLQVPENVFEKETVLIKISLRNEKRWFPAFSILVEDEALIRTRGWTAWLRKWFFEKPQWESAHGAIWNETRNRRWSDAPARHTMEWLRRG